MDLKKDVESLLEDARSFWHNLVEKHLTYEGATPALNADGEATIANLIKKRKIGRWDEMMTPDELVQVQATPSKLNDVAALIAAWHIRSNDADKNVTPPTETEHALALYQMVSQIFKTLGIPKDHDGSEVNV